MGPGGQGARSLGVDLRAPSHDDEINGFGTSVFV